MKLLCDCLKDNKISANANKIEFILFRYPNKSVNYNLELLNVLNYQTQN